MNNWTWFLLFLLVASVSLNIAGGVIARHEITRLRILGQYLISRYYQDHVYPSLKKAAGEKGGER